MCLCLRPCVCPAVHSFTGASAAAPSFYMAALLQVCNRQGRAEPDECAEGLRGAGPRGWLLPGCAAYMGPMWVVSRDSSKDRYDACAPLPPRRAGLQLIQVAHPRSVIRQPLHSPISSQA